MKSTIPAIYEPNGSKNKITTLFTLLPHFAKISDFISQNYSLDSFNLQRSN